MTDQNQSTRMAWPKFFRWFFGCDTSESTDATIGFSADEISSVALDIVKLSGVTGVGDSFWGGSLSACDRMDAKIAEARMVNKNRQPRRIRKEVEAWLKYYSGRIKESRADLKSGAHRREMDRYKQERQNHWTRVNDLKKRLHQGTSR